MKKKIWKIVCALLGVFVFLWMILPGLMTNGSAGDATQLAKINELAQYLNDKYGYSISSMDCVYFREEDYSYHDGILYGETYNVPYIAIFDYEGKQIAVTDRKGFLSDDAQLEEIYDLIHWYCEKESGLDILFVEITIASDHGGTSSIINKILHHSFNEKVSEDNIDDFMHLLFTSDEGIALTFYFKAEEDQAAQIEKITQGLQPFAGPWEVLKLRFYITEQEELNILYSNSKENVLKNPNKYSREKNDHYVWSTYHVINDVKTHYAVGEGAANPNPEWNYFLWGGEYNLNRGYAAGFVGRECTTIRNFEVADLSDAALETYEQEMVNYGKYRGYTILFDVGEDDGTSDLTIVNGDKYRWSFQWGSGSVKMYAFKHGRLMDLETAYECGYLDYSDMDAILEEHKENYESHYGVDYDDIT